VPTAVSGGGAWSAVAAGGSHTAALKADGSIWCWGMNGSGQLGDGTSVGKGVPTAVSGGGTWSAVSGGGSHTAALKADGSLWCWGQNSAGQLGDGTTASKNAPTSIPLTGAGAGWSAHTPRIACGLGYAIALRSDGSL
jgi:alpha-tubulin suppressor-like RCC1 family protein